MEQVNRNVTVHKPIPYTFDLGSLLCSDLNALPPTPNTNDLSIAARDCAQTLINQILTTCPIRTSTLKGTCIVLPLPSTPFPRKKTLPKARAETRWEQFARKKGIKSKARSKSKIEYNEETGEWTPKWGYKGRKQDHGTDWIVEVDERKEKELEDGETVRGQGRRDKKEHIRRDAQKQGANMMRQRKLMKKG